MRRPSDPGGAARGAPMGARAPWAIGEIGQKNALEILKEAYQKEWADQVKKSIIEDIQRIERKQ
jgi:hypothetical protein